MDVALALRRELSARSRSSDGVTIVVADRSFEAWILAGSEGLYARGFLVASYRGSFEGELGERSQKGAVELGRLCGPLRQDARRSRPVLCTRFRRGARQ